MPAWPASSRNWPWPASDVVEASIDELEQVVATDEQRAADRSRIGRPWPRSVGRRRHRSSVIRPMTGRSSTVEAAPPATPIAGGRHTKEAADGEVHGRPFGVLRGDRRAARRGARPRPRDRGRRRRPLRAGLARPRGGQGLLPRDRPVAGSRSCGSTSGPATRRPRSTSSRSRCDDATTNRDPGGDGLRADGHGVRPRHGRLCPGGHPRDGPQRDGPVQLDRAGREGRLRPVLHLRRAAGRRDDGPALRELRPGRRPGHRSAPARGARLRAAGRRHVQARRARMGPGRSRGGDRARPSSARHALSDRAEPLRHRARLLRAALLALQVQPARAPSRTGTRRCPAAARATTAADRHSDRLRRRTGSGPRGRSEPADAAPRGAGTIAP